MRFLKWLFNFYINSSIHVALSVFSLTWITLLSFDLECSKAVLYFVFYASVTGYNFVKYFDIAKWRYKPLTKGLKWIQIWSFVCFLLMCFHAVQLRWSTCLFILCLALLTVFYAIPVFPKQNATLRSLGGIKIYIIALVWSGATVFMPIINSHFEMNADVFILGVQRFLYVLVLMFPFEIRDLKYDDSRLSTIPQKLGIKRTKGIGVLLLCLFFLLEFFKNQTTERIIIALLLVSIITGVLMVFSKVEQHKYYSSFWVEGIPLVWLILYLFRNFL